jgi:hypothetical protein
MNESPTFNDVLERQGMRAAINMWAERRCMSVIRDIHRDAKEHGFNLARPDYKPPWWFKIASRIEWITRPPRPLPKWREGAKQIGEVMSRARIDPLWGALATKDQKHRREQNAELSRIPIARIRHD